MIRTPSPLLPRIAGLTHPAAAATIGVLAWLLLWKMGAIGSTAHDSLLRPFPLPTRFDSWIALPLGALAALLVTLLRRGRPARWARSLIGIAGVGVFGVAVFFAIRAIRAGCFHMEGCDLLFTYVDAGLLGLASGLLLALARVEPAPRARWWGLGLVCLAAGSSALWTHAATAPSERFEGAQLSAVRLVGYFSTNSPFVPSDTPPRSRTPSAVPMLPMRGSTLLCGGDWRVMAFPDRGRCLPHRPLIAINPGEVRSVEVAAPEVGRPPGILLTLTSAAARRLSEALRAARSHRLVFLNGRGDLVIDAPVWEALPGPTFMLSFGEPRPGELEEALGALLGRPGAGAAGARRDGGAARDAALAAP